MQLRLIDEWGPCPRDGYRYVFPDDGFVAHAWTYVDWVQVAKNHLTANNKPIPPDLEGQMQNQLCLTLAPGYCLYDDDNRPRPSVSLSFSDVAAGVKTFASWVTRGMQYVGQAEAERRAAICSRCYLNVNVHGCSGCQKIVTQVLGKKQTKLDNSLRTCAVCKCFLKIKVHFPLKLLIDNENPGVQQLYPEHCWLNKHSENFNDSDSLQG